MKRLMGGRRDMRHLVPLLLIASWAHAQSPADKLLVLDPRLIDPAKTVNAHLVQGTITKHPANPLFKADKSWENALNNLYPNIVYDEAEKRFKLWYKCVLSDKDVIARMNPPFTVHDVGWFLLYATSTDGVKWEKPELDLFSFDNSKKNNIVARDTPNVGVLRDDHDPDAQRRYKMIFDQGPGQMLLRFSADGVHWADPVKPEGVGAMGDTHNTAFWDPHHNRYIMISRLFLGERLVHASTSQDFVHWTPSQLALRSNPDEGKTRQTYCMTAFVYGGGYVGLVMMYNAATDRAVDCELTYSTDGLKWSRPFAGKPFIPRGEKGTYDSACIYAQANSPVVRDDKLYLFYGGSDVVHRGWKRHCLPCLATLRVDGFAAYEAIDREKPAQITTLPLQLSGAPLSVSANAGGGSVEMSLIDEQGKAIDQAKPIATDAIDAVLEWQTIRDWSAMKGKTVRIAISMRGAKLYAISGIIAMSPPVQEKK